MSVSVSKLSGLGADGDLRDHVRKFEVDDSDGRVGTPTCSLEKLSTKPLLPSECCRHIIKFVTQTSYTWPQVRGRT